MKKLILYIVLGIGALGAQAQAFVHNYGGEGNEIFRAIEKHPAGGFVALGTTGSELHSQTDMYLVRVDDQLQCMWSLNLGASGVEQGNALTIDSNGNILAVGYSVEDPTLGYQNFAVLVDQDGNQLWEKRWGDAGWDLAAAVTVDGNNEFWIASNAISPVGGQSITLNHLDVSGNVVSSFVANSSLVDEAVRLKFYNDSLYLLINTSDALSHTTAIRQMAVTGGQGHFYASQQTNVKGYDFDISSYGILLAGSYTNGTFQNYYAVLFDQAGNQLAEHEYTASADAYYTGVTHNSNSFNLVGITNSFGAGGNDVVVQRFGPNADWWGGGSLGTPTRDEAVAVICSNDTLYAVGVSDGFETAMQDQAVIIKSSYDLNNLTSVSTNNQCFFVGVAEVEMASASQLWRIAANEALWVGTTNQNEVYLYSVTGACLYHGVNVTRLPLNYASGMYLLRTVSSGKIAVQSLVR